MKSSFVIQARRTPVAPRGGAFANTQLHDLGAAAAVSCLEKAGIEPNQVDEIIVGNALGAGGNPARMIALAANLPETVAGLSIDRQCCSGLDALLLADALIGAGKAQIVLAGGAESYSQRPTRTRQLVQGGPIVAYDQPPFAPWPNRDPDMAVAADNLAREMNITKTDQDAWAVESHRKAMSAKVKLRREIVPLTPKTITDDAFTRNLTMQTCARAKPLAGSVTTANTSVAADAAGFCLVVSEEIAKNISGPMMRIVGGTTLGSMPELPGLAPVAAIKKTLKMSNVAARDLSTAEIMEAYAVQAIACVRAGGIGPDIVNIGGGSLARGHPIAASGTILAVRLFHELADRGGYGLAAIAAAGGLGTALILQT